MDCGESACATVALGNIIGAGRLDLLFCVCMLCMPSGIVCTVSGEGIFKSSRMMFCAGLGCVWFVTNKGAEVVVARVLRGIMLVRECGDVCNNSALGSGVVCGIAPVTAVFAVILVIVAVIFESCSDANC